MAKTLKSLYRLHADLYRTVAHAKRLEILDLLREGECNVSEIARAMEVPAVNVSQHLAPLRGAGIVHTRRDGKTIYYRVSSERILRAYDLMTELARELAAARAEVVRRVDPRES